MQPTLSTGFSNKGLLRVELYFRFTLSNKRDKFNTCSVVISLAQKLSARKEEKSIGFRVYRLSAEDNREPLLGPRFIDNAVNLVKTSGAFINLREVNNSTLEI